MLSMLASEPVGIEARGDLLELLRLPPTRDDLGEELEGLPSKLLLLLPLPLLPGLRDLLRSR